MQAIEKLMEEHAAGSQADMNDASNICSVVSKFATTYEYCRLIGLVESDSKAIGMSDLYYNEFCQWWKIKEAANSLMSHLTYAAANYSMAPLEMATYIDNCYKNRQSELKSEKQLIATENWKSFKSELTDITAQKHDNLVNFFKSINTQHVADLFDAEVFGRDYAIEMAEEYFDLDKITKAGNQYASALSEWRSVREQIAQSLPEEKRESYREMTKQTHARLYKNLLELKTVKR
ncbi:MAG: hypothetical protein J6V60_01685 [Muribaculaceae bacterium]|nr:hypothetical protein [Muribaculaceae bacterium]